MLTATDLADAVTIPEAAERLGCSQAAVRNWIARRNIARLNPESPGRPYYRLIDIARAEQAARHHSLRRLRPQKIA